MQGATPVNTAQNGSVWTGVRAGMVEEDLRRALLEGGIHLESHRRLRDGAAGYYRIPTFPERKIFHLFLRV